MRILFWDQLNIALYQMNIFSADKNQNIVDTTFQKAQHNS